jgi:2-polyprenyl-3-methyl-5-hydroxy-6-metoxy-1,4-benzoquinol methylase
VDISGWNERYRSKERAGEDLQTEPTKLVVKAAQNLSPGKALDLACGTGRNAIWLAREGWDVTAVDGARAALEILEERAKGECKRKDRRSRSSKGRIHHHALSLGSHHPLLLPAARFDRTS